MDYLAAVWTPTRVTLPKRRDVTALIDAYCVARAISRGVSPQTLEFPDRVPRKSTQQPQVVEDAVWHDVTSAERL
jgi:hypothetical protein